MTEFRRSPFIAGGAAGAPAVAPAQVLDALRTVIDPEIGMSVVDLGLIYGIDVEGDRVAVTMTLTVPGCPLHEAIPEWVREAAARLPGVGRVDVTLTFDPPWTPERMGRLPEERPGSA
jgi:metal-sulfur cluster biosynthetic enzyme